MTQTTKGETMRTIELGNNETKAIGISENSDGTYTAVTLTQSATRKTRRGAENWLRARGYNADGKRLSST